MKKLINEIKKNQKITESDKMKLPISLNELAKAVQDQRNYVDQVLLEQYIVELYAFNPNIFPLIIGDDILKKTEFDPKYLIESACYIAELVTQNKVYAVPNGIFVSWHLTKVSKHSKKLTVEKALEECSKYHMGMI
jgi:hypothetical protein